MIPYNIVNSRKYLKCIINQHKAQKNIVRWDDKTVKTMYYSFKLNTICNFTKLFDWKLNENCSNGLEFSQKTYVGDVVSNIFEIDDESDVHHAHTAIILASISYLILLRFTASIDGTIRKQSTSKIPTRTSMNQWILENCDSDNNIFVVMCAVTVVLTLPLTILLLLLALAYREIVHFDIKVRLAYMPSNFWIELHYRTGNVIFAQHLFTNLTIHAFRMIVHIHYVVYGGAWPKIIFFSTWQRVLLSKQTDSHQTALPFHSQTC